MKEMKLIPVLVAALLFAIAGCAQPERNVQPAKAAPVGAHFDATGRVALHAGQPCTSQIMFDFNARGSNRPVYLAARMRESKILTDAANRNRNVHVSGTWQRGKIKGCSYVNVAEVAQ